MRYAVRLSAWNKAARAPGIRQWVWWGSGVLWVLGVVVSLWPEPDAVALVSAEGWKISGLASIGLPSASDVRQSIRKSPEAVFWRSWTPERGAIPGRAETEPFSPPPYFVIPYGGFPGDPGIRLYVECVADGKIRDATRARTNTQSAEALLRRDRAWCPGPVKVVASSQSSQSYISVGTPFEVAWISVIKRSFVGLFALAGAAFGVLLLPVLAGHKVAVRLGRADQGFLIGCIALGLFGYLAFFAFFASPFIGKAFALSGLIGSGWIVARYPRLASGTGDDADRAPYILWAFASLAYIALLYSASNGGGAWHVNARYLPVRWSSDNQLPYLIAEALVRGASLSDLSFGSWKVSDRPPLMAGAMAIARLVGAFAAGDDGRYRLFTLYQSAGLFLNALAIPVVYMLMRSLARTRAAVSGAVLIFATSGFAIFNVTYTWPKMCAGAFALAGLAFLIGERGIAKERVQSVTLVTAGLSGCALGLSLVSHGSVIFSVAAVLVWAFIAGHMRSFPAMSAAVITMVLVVLPWSLWQHFIQPPGNALVKFAFAGTYGWGEEDMGVFATIARAYAQIDLTSWLSMKREALGSILGFGAPSCGLGEMAPSGASTSGELRIADFLSVGGTLRFMVVGVVAGLVLALPLIRCAVPELKRPALLLLALGTAAIAANVLTTWTCHIVHHQAYPAIVWLLAGSWLAALSVGGRLAWALLVLSLTYSGTVWIALPIFDALNRDYAALAVFLACVGGLTLVSFSGAAPRPGIEAYRSIRPTQL